MNGKTIAIIDNEISSSIVLKHTIIKLQVNDNLSIDVIKGDKLDNAIDNFDNHADICAKIILKYAKCHVNIINIIVNSNADGKFDAFLKGLEICSLLNIDIVNISIGIIDLPRREMRMLHKYVKKIKKNGTELVAAFSNGLEKTWPAAFKEVIGCVSPSHSVGRLKRYVVAAGQHYIRNNYGEIFLTDDSNSFATAYVTGLRCKD